MRFLILCFALLGSLSAQEASITKDKVLKTGWDAGKKEVREAYPEMLGVILVDADSVLYILNKKLAILVNEEEIEEVWVGDNVLDWQLGSTIRKAGVRTPEIEVGPGISEEMDFPELEELLEGNIGAPDYRASAEYDGLAYSFSLAGTAIEGGSFSLRSMRVSKLEEIEEAKEQQEADQKEIDFFD